MSETTAPAAEAMPIELELSSGRIHGERRGDPGAPLTLCVHGLSGTLRSFDRIAPLLVEAGRQVVAVDLRGRGRSEITAPGTYGLPTHARDVLEIATALDAERFDLVGWSMGGLIGIVIASEEPERLRTLTLIDHAGAMDERALDAVARGLARLDAVVETPDQYVAAIRAIGAIDPWSPLWDAVYRYELGEVDGGFSPTTSRAACEEDLDVAAVEGLQAMWPAMTMPALLVRCTGLLNGGLIVPDETLTAVRAAVPALEVLEVETNHFTVMDDARAADAIAAHVGRSG